MAASAAKYPVVTSSGNRAVSATSLTTRALPATAPVTRAIAAQSPVNKVISAASAGPRTISAASLGTTTISASSVAKASSPIATQAATSARVVSASSPRSVIPSAKLGTTVIGSSTLSQTSRQARIISAPTVRSGVREPATTTRMTSTVSPTSYTQSAKLPVSVGRSPINLTSSQPRTVQTARIIAVGQPSSTGVVLNPSPLNESSGYVATVDQMDRNVLGLAGPVATRAAYEVKHQHDSQLSNLKDVKKACALKKVPVKVAMEAFKAAAVDGKLTREMWFDVHGKVLDDCGVEHPPPEVKNAVFDLFDRDDNDIVDMIEVVCATSLLCKGSEEDKVDAVFYMFDQNGDGFISVDEMQKFLLSVFRVVCTPNVMQAVNSTGVNIESIEDMAAATTWECFQSADLNHDGRLSLDEFKKWFGGARSDPSLLFQPVQNMLDHNQ